MNESERAMGQVTYIEHNGTEHEVNVPDGYSIMEAAVQDGIAGIDGDCGGACACATCHVYVDERWLDRTGPPGADEAVMLNLAEDVRPNSRLSCQIQMSQALDGLVVTMPASQH